MSTGRVVIMVDEEEERSVRDQSSEFKCICELEVPA